MTDPRRLLPAVETLLSDDAVRRAAGGASPDLLRLAVRQALEAARRSRDMVARDWALEVSDALASLRSSTLAPVINATGVIIHTNLGRAPLAAAAVDAAAAASAYTTVEFDLGTGVRRDRATHCCARLCRLTGSEDAHVVNNAAAGLVLAVAALAKGRPVAVSRGELIEIGGSFRIPEIIEAGGAPLMEIGTTNRTTLDDYRHAASAGAAALLVVHRSNFTVTGFVESVPLAAVADVAREHGIPSIYDQGTGLLDRMPGLPADEPSLRMAVRSTVDVVVASGDKLLGGPQAGILLGARELVRSCRRHPLARAVRPGKLTLAALDATLALHESGASDTIPVLAMLSVPGAVLRKRANLLAEMLGEVAGDVVRTEALAGGGTLPALRLPSWAVRVPGSRSAAALALALRRGEPPVIARMEDNAVMLDVRTVREQDLVQVAKAVRRAVASVGAAADSVPTGREPGPADQ